MLLVSSEDRKCNSLPIFRSRQVVASGWQPRVNGSFSDPAGLNPSRSSAALWENKFEVHANTPRDDPVFGILRPLTLD